MICCYCKIPQSAVWSVQIADPLCCFADVDSCSGFGAQWCILLWLCAALQCVLCDLQPPHQPCWCGSTPHVPASLLHHMCCHHCNSSVTQVHSHTLKHTTVNTQTHTPKNHMHLKVCGFPFDIHFYIKILVPVPLNQYMLYWFKTGLRVIVTNIVTDHCVEFKGFYSQSVKG